MMSLKNVWKKQGKTDLIRRKKSKSIQFSDEKFCKNGIKCNFAIPGVLAPKLALCDRPVRDDSILCCHLRRQNTETKKMPSIRPFDSLICVYYRKIPVNRGIFIGVPGGSPSHQSLRFATGLCGTTAYYAVICDGKIPKQKKCRLSARSTPLFVFFIEKPP